VDGGKGGEKGGYLIRNVTYSKRLIEPRDCPERQRRGREREGKEKEGKESPTLLINS